MRSNRVMAAHVDGSLVVMTPKRAYSETHLARQRSVVMAATLQRP
jgi:hypothetical protein